MRISRVIFTSGTRVPRQDSMAFGLVDGRRASAPKGLAVSGSGEPEQPVWREKTGARLPDFYWNDYVSAKNSRIT
jgi:hypothetical protein